MAKIIKFNPRGDDENRRKKTSGEENREQTPSMEEKENKKVLKISSPSRKEEPSFLKSKKDQAQPLTEEDYQKLFEPFKEGLKRLYPSQVEDVLGYTALGEKNGENAFMVGRVIWKRYGVEQPYLSTFVAYFEKGELKKISFLEAKNNYWDWRTMLKLHKGEFHTEEIFNRFMEFVNGQFLV
jgi:hypothetical protein